LIHYQNYYDEFAEIKYTQNCTENFYYCGANIATVEALSMMSSILLSFIFMYDRRYFVIHKTNQNNLSYNLLRFFKKIAASKLTFKMSLSHKN